MVFENRPGNLGGFGVKVVSKTRKIFLQKLGVFRTPISLKPLNITHYSILPYRNKHCYKYDFFTYFRLVMIGDGATDLETYPTAVSINC